MADVPLPDNLISMSHGPFKPSMYDEGENYCVRCHTRSIYLASRQCNPHIDPDALRAYVAAVTAAKDAEIAGLRAELFAHQVYIRVLCKAVDAATDFAGTVAGGASWWDDVWAEHFRALDAARAELIKSLADNAALRADAIDRQNNVVAPLRERVRELTTQAMFNAGVKARP